MANAIVSFTVERLGDLLAQEAEFLYGVSNQVQSIQAELKRMLCFLKDADSKASNGDERVRNWVAQVRDLAYDAEDVIETYALKVASSRRRRRRREGIKNVLKSFACILNEGIALYKVGLEIEAITAKISNLTSSLQTYGIKGIENESSNSAYQRQLQLQRSYSHVVERDVVGRDESIKELVVCAVNNEKHYRIFSIYGMGGLGKTSLAKKIYRHSEGEDSKLSDREIAKKLYQVLQEKRCLVILDDIWSIQAWDSLRAAFPYEETSSKILLTTRNKEVALHADPTGFHYEPRCLAEEESWELLQKIAIPQKDGVDIRIDTRMEELGKKMVNYCGGLPLAITVLGGLLATKSSSNEWHTVYETIKSCLKRGKGHGQEQSGVFDVLALSYDDLPTELKPCFLYLSHFPEDYEIRVDKLIRLWVAEGIITTEQHNREDGKEMVEEVAERYLNELVKRCMVLVEEKDASLSLRIRTCRMHDLMRDLCLAKAKEENFLLIINDRNGDENFDIFSTSSSDKIRRLTINMHGHLTRGILKRIKHRHLRSLLCFYEFHDKPCSLEIPNFNNLKFLRVLDLDGAPMEWKLPKHIGKLIHLRSLNLRNASMYNLPSSLGNLRCLQNLDLRVSTKVHIPNVLWKLEGLRHLYLPLLCDDKTKLRLGNLRNLLTLMNFSANICDVRDLVNMTNLRKLYIEQPDLIKCFGETFKSLGITLKHLRSLSLSDSIWEKTNMGSLISGCINLYELRLCVPLEKLPDYCQFSASITDILLSDTQLEEDPMATLEKLPNLRTLSFYWNAYIKKQMVCSGEGFPRLYSLIIVLPHLEEWRVDEGAMSNLCHLKLSWCENLKTFPYGFRFVKSLKELEITGMPKEFKNKLVQGGEDFYKVHHVPSVTFRYCDDE